MCPPWVEGAHAGAPLQVMDILTYMSATWYKTRPAAFSALENYAPDLKTLLREEPPDGPTPNFEP